MTKGREKKYYNQDKLIELLNEYENRDIELEEWEECNARTENKGHLWFNGANTVQFDIWMFDSLAFSKKYGFIKWLVENDKIDYEKIENCYIYHDDEGSWEKELLMQLAIQDNPLDFLVSILK